MKHKYKVLLRQCTALFITTVRPNDQILPVQVISRTYFGYHFVVT